MIDIKNIVLKLEHHFINHFVMEGWLFGSYSRQQNNSHSDLDIAILFESDIDNFDQKKDELLNSLNNDFNINFDLRNLFDILAENDSLKFLFNKEKIKIYPLKDNELTLLPRVKFREHTREILNILKIKEEIDFLIEDIIPLSLNTVIQNKFQKKAILFSINRIKNLSKKLSIDYTNKMLLNLHNPEKLLFDLKNNSYLSSPNKWNKFTAQTVILNNNIKTMLDNFFEGGNYYENEQ